jgi:hypothetical protein
MVHLKYEMVRDELDSRGAKKWKTDTAISAKHVCSVVCT